jgi:hypothetical protein
MVQKLVREGTLSKAGMLGKNLLVPVSEVMERKARRDAKKNPL